ncbi:hypothetical protein EJ05DRAFT_22234 [Pseudovirgaria hyperparasitica]|uniref:Uncharacterized protein n=1 Tax=Pseudovirgaria hyperparasitica TaxID=470096 RepID=A0A6A6WL88_9PEZI|nr:uncharacterized protein EJ05DRAFT_22234 [Pseudovirgaria hyperparasitica]KAF2762974.1 hypothetical protein EJ05DRAFT_22234 [Pseudovirgaria hyperparasitica]
MQVLSTCAGTMWVPDATSRPTLFCPLYKRCCCCCCGGFGRPQSIPYLPYLLATQHSVSGINVAANLAAGRHRLHLIRQTHSPAAPQTIQRCSQPK